MLPSSPRARRRLGWMGAVLVTALAAGVTVTVLPRAKTVRDTLRPGPVVKHEREVEVTPEMRRAINATLDKFIPAALLGRDPALAWKLAGPALRGGTTRADWLRGETPVWRYPARNVRIHDWQPIFAYRDRVAFDLLFHPRAGAKLGPIAVSVDMARRRGGWIVDSWYVAAVFNAPDEEPWVTGQADFTTEYSMNDHLKSPKFQQRKLAAAWIALPLALLGSIFVVPLVLGTQTLLRRRRAAG